MHVQCENGVHDDSKASCLKIDKLVDSIHKEYQTKQEVISTLWQKKSNKTEAFAWLLEIGLPFWKLWTWLTQTSPF
jgi:hypothetical protein